MTDTPRLLLGTRQSPLAMAQAHEARDRLCRAHGWDAHAVELVPVIASGDRIQDRPLAEIGGKALWTKELDAWLVEGRIDAAVHSMKDVETLRPAEIAIGAILPRADVADVLVGAASIRGIPQGARVGTSAPRRAAQMLHHRPDCTIVGIRGNVATRLAKLQAGEADVLALRVDRTTRRVRLDRVICFQAQGNFVQVWSDEGNFLATTTLRKLIEALPQGQFAQVHRSFVVRRDRVVAQSGATLCLDTGMDIPIGRSYRKLTLIR